MPFAAWMGLAFVAERLPGTPPTRNQIELMRRDNITASGFPGFSDLGSKPTAIETVIRKMRD